MTRTCNKLSMWGTALGVAAIVAACTSSAKGQCVDDGAVLSPCEALPSAPQCEGDTDGDGDIDAADCAGVTAHLASFVGEDLCRYDLDCDGDIDPDDEAYCSGVATGPCGSTDPCFITSMDFRATGGQVSGAGATLFVDFFRAPSSTNDWNDVDGDGFSGFDAGGPPFTDNLSTRFTPGSNNQSYWMFQYRSVGSVNGFNEFVLNQICDTIPTSIPAEAGIFNQFEYATGGVTNWGGPFANASGTPFEPCGIDFSFLDVPSAWAVRTEGDAKWSRTPGDVGYGLNPITSSTGYVSNLESYTRDCGSGPVSIDANDVFDYTAAWVPVAYIANRGTGVTNVKYTEMQHLFVTGRMPNGENLVGATRSVGSGTRNAIMNSTGIDTSWGRGDNVGNEFALTTTANLGPIHQAVNCQGSSQIEQAVQMRRLAIGYTGLCGASRAASDALSGSYEVLNLCKDVVRGCIGGANDGDPCGEDSDCPSGKCGYLPGCDCSVAHSCDESMTIDPMTGLPIDVARPNTGYVRPGISTLLDNCDACCGYQIGGLGSFVTVGDPDANRDLADPAYETNLAVANQAVADYLNNIEDSVNEFAGNVFTGTCESSLSCNNVRTCDGGGNDNAVCTLDTFCDTNPAPGIQFFCRPKPCTSGTAAADCSGSVAACVVTSCSIDDQCRDAADFCRQTLNMPGQFLAVQFTLPAGVDCVNQITTGVDFVATSPLNQVLQEYVRANNTGCNPPAAGSINPAGRTPFRSSLTGGAKYSDGRTDQNYLYYNSTTLAYSNLLQGQRLSRRNRTQGDADGDFDRDLADAAGLVAAMYAPRTWQTTPAAMGAGVGSDLGNQTHDSAMPEVIFDFNGDGNLTKEDLRYYADGLAMDGGALDRKAGAIAIDAAIVAGAQPFPWAYSTDSHLIPAAASGLNPTFNVPPSMVGFLATGATYENGDFRGDVAGNASRAPIPGAEPVGYDGVVDAKDIDYVCRNIGDWTDLNSAVYIDLSADMDGDLDVDSTDVEVVVIEMLETSYGDANLDGAVDSADMAIVNGPHACNTTMTCGWADGDFNCDRVVNGDDAAAFSGACCNGAVCTDGAASACTGYVCNVTALLGVTCFGDADGNGTVNAGDRGFVSANIGQTANDLVCLFDMDGNGTINPADRGFVSANIGVCTGLPNYQNGSGLNALGTGPDPRFPAAAFQGGGTTCASVSCP